MACTHTQHCSIVFIISKDSFVHNSKTHSPNLSYTVELYLSEIMRTRQAARFFKESSSSLPWLGTVGPRDFIKYHNSCCPHLVYSQFICRGRSYDVKKTNKQNLPTPDGKILISTCIYRSKRKNWSPEAAIAGKVSTILLHLPKHLSL